MFNYTYINPCSKPFIIIIIFFFRKKATFEKKICLKIDILVDIDENMSQL